MISDTQGQVLSGRLNINSRLAEMVRRFAGRDVLVDPSGSWTFGQLWALSNATAGLLSKLTRRQRIGIMLPAVKEFGAAFYGAMLAGKTVVPVNFLLAPSEIRKIAVDAELDCIVTTRVLMDRLGGLELPCVFVEDMKDALTSAAQKQPTPPDGAFALDPDSPAVVIYTAGTSGDPKGVVLSHANLLANTDGCVKALQLHENFRLLASLPFFHVFGLTTGLIMPVAFGATAVMLPKFSVQGLVSTVRAHGVNIILTIPSMWTVLVRSGVLDRETLSSLEFCVSGGEPLPTSTAMGFAQAMGRPLLEGYGMTETSPVISLNLPEANRTGSVGRPLPGVSVRVMDETGNALGPNQEGEVLVSGPGVMKGYHGRPDLTAESLTSDGWLRTGDLGRFDGDGYLYITGRVKDLVITGGENVNPREVEEVLLTCPGVADVAVVGIPSRSRGEQLAAFIVCASGATVEAEEVKAFCRNHLAGYKVPRQVEFVGELPRN